MEGQVDSGLTRPAWPMPGPEEESEGLALGPYRLVRDPVSGPGAWLGEGRMANGTRVLVQLIALKPTSSPEARAARDAYERTITRDVATISAHGGTILLGQGHVDAEDGRRLLYWVMPWPVGFGGAEALTRRPRSWTEVAAIGRAVAQRLAEAHAQDQSQPQLTEAALIFSADRRAARLSGLPIVIRSEWITPETLPTRLAPEEQAEGTATKRGDIWRLGQALRALGEPLGAPPIELATLLRAMVQDDPQRRLRRAADVAKELDVVAASFETKPPEVLTTPREPVDHDAPTVAIDITVKSGELVIESIESASAVSDAEALPKIVEPGPEALAPGATDAEQAGRSAEIEVPGLEPTSFAGSSSTGPAILAPALTALPSSSVEARWFNGRQRDSGLDAASSAPPIAARAALEALPSARVASPRPSALRRRRKPIITPSYWIARGLLGIAAGAVVALITYFVS